LEVTQPIRERPLKFYLSDKAYRASFDRLQSLGFNGDFENPAIGGENANGFEVDCKNDEYGDKWQLPNPNAVPASPDAIRRLNALYRQTKGATQPTETAPAKPNTPPTPTTSVHDDDHCGLAHVFDDPEVNRTYAWTLLKNRWASKKTEAEMGRMWDGMMASVGKLYTELSAAEWVEVFKACDCPF
jgi:hypothetical protein